MRENEQVVERMAKYYTRRFLSHSTHLATVVAAETMEVKDNEWRSRRGQLYHRPPISR